MRILITGHTGSLGSAVVPKLLDARHEVVGFSRCEYRQSQYEFKSQITQYLGDIRDRDRLLEASRSADCIMHFAALKRIESAEEQPEEAVATNIRGTENVLFAQRMNRVSKVIFVSTDKACLPVTCYGATKQVGERLVLRNPRNVVCRYGNVLASRGSILSAFRDSIASDGKIYVTHRDMTRFWWTLDDAAEFVVHQLQMPGGLRIPEMKAYPVQGIGRLIASVLGAPPPYVEVIGIRGIEKIHEHLRAPEEGGEIHSGMREHWWDAEKLSAVLSGVLEGK